MPGNHQRRTSRRVETRHPRGSAMMARSRDDAASEIASVDGARDMSASFAREGSGDFDSREGSGGLDSRRPDRDPSPFQATRGAARGGFVFGSSRCHGTSSPSPAASGVAARGGDPEERGRIWKKTDFPTDDALRKCRSTSGWLCMRTIVTFLRPCSQYRRLQTLWHDCTNALAVFTKHSANTEFCGQKVTMMGSSARCIPA